jgi:hypothetical protein
MPHRLSLEHIAAAMTIIDPVFLHTPQFRAEALDPILGCQLVASAFPTGSRRDTLREQIGGVIASAQPGHMPAADALAGLLSELAAGRITAEQAQAQLTDTPDLLLLVQALAGQELRLDTALITFGAGSQLGDISIGDVAGRDVIKLTFAVQQTIISSELAYDVRGLPNPYRGLRAFTYAELVGLRGGDRVAEAGRPVIGRGRAAARGHHWCSQPKRLASRDIAITMTRVNSFP